jgi:hypothetical protein
VSFDFAATHRDDKEEFFESSSLYVNHSRSKTLLNFHFQATPGESSRLPGSMWKNHSRLGGSMDGSRMEGESSWGGGHKQEGRVRVIPSF